MLDFIKLDLSRIQAIAHSNDHLHIIFTNSNQNLEIKSFPVPSQAIDCFKALSEVNNRKTVTLPNFEKDQHSFNPNKHYFNPNQIEMITVDELKAGHSDIIKAIGYEPKGEILQVRFTTDATYQYCDVPYNGFLNFLTSDSVDSFFSQFIKNRFEHQRVD
jgi:hypothetical protein